jgi:DNA-binding NarL/FixJ family response regulator
MTTNLLLADDNTATRSALAFILGRRLGLHVAGEASTAAELNTLLGVVDSGILILDWDLPGLGQFVGLATLRKANPHLRIIVLSTHLDVRPLALACGADAFISMAEPPEVLLSIVHAEALCDPAFFEG